MEILGCIVLIVAVILVFHDIAKRRRESARNIEPPSKDVVPPTITVIEHSTATPPISIFPIQKKRMMAHSNVSQKKLDQVYRDQVEKLKKIAEEFDKPYGKLFKKEISPKEDEEDRLEREEKRLMRRLERKGFPSNREIYKEYLRSSQWELTRVKKLKQAGYKCESCQIEIATQVHHVRYPDWKMFNWYEDEEDLANLAAVCDECHKKAHEIEPIEVRQKKLNL